MDEHTEQDQDVAEHTARVRAAIIESSKRGADYYREGLRWLGEV
jgi:hypothetical protein